MTFRILTVCTANICRSPVAQYLLASELPADRFEVTSAGVDALVGAPVETTAANELKQRGIDASGFEARQLTSDLLVQSDLILTATLDHRAAAVQMRPAVLHRAFTVLEFADLVGRVEALGLKQLVRAAALQRYTSTVERDLEDPIGREPEVHAATAARIEQAVAAIAGALSARRQP